MYVRNSQALCLVLALTTVTGCSNMSSMGTTNTTTTTSSMPASVISQLSTMVTIGSTVDTGGASGAPGVGDSNPYGLAIVPSTVVNTSTVGSSSLVISPGDLIVCNFNSSASNGVGMGTTVEDLKPTPGSMPVRIAQSASLQGCDALALNPTKGFIWAAAYTANDNPVVTPTGAVTTAVTSSYMWDQPWGQVFGSPMEPMGSTTTAPSSFYISDAGDGSIVQGLVSASPATYTKIITGFPTSVSKTYGILAPAGLTYDPSTDTLYVVSSDTDSVLAFKGVSTYVAGGVNITYTPGSSMSGSYSMGTAASFAFSGPNAANAKVIFSGSPLNYPVSSALLYNGDLIVGNTGDNNMVEISPSTMTVVGTKSVDPNAPGAIFGIATSGTSLATQKIYFNDDNTNSVMQISQ
jgi:hypothetical protein